MSSKPGLSHSVYLSTNKIKLKLLLLNFLEKSDELALRPQLICFYWQSLYVLPKPVYNVALHDIMYL